MRNMFDSALKNLATSRSRRFLIKSILTNACSTIIFQSFHTIFPSLFESPTHIFPYSLKIER